MTAAHPRNKLPTRCHHRLLVNSRKGPLVVLPGDRRAAFAIAILPGNYLEAEQTAWEIFATRADLRSCARTA